MPILAFATPITVFLLIGISIIVIGYFIAPAPQLAPPPASELQDAAPQPDQDADTDNQPSAAPTETDRPAQKPPVEADAYLAGLDKKQVELRIMRTELLLQYTEQHPDVMQVDRQLEQLRIERRRYLQQLKKN
ncbi:MAG: hypothetical protein K0M46_07460 [Thiobacillus sp.]|nr:hypothetical protein [Thiobacillus sp.]